MAGNHYWKKEILNMAITAPENDKMGEGWVEITYEEYQKLLKESVSSIVQLPNQTDGQ
jgi:hypothetical protein